MKAKAFYLVLDFEANCSGENTKDHEIIEFPAVLVKTDTHAIIDEFRTFVRLVKHSKLSDFIKQLTHITDEQVNQGLEWGKCLHEFELWCKKHGLTTSNCAIVTCGDWDLKTMLPNQLALTKTKLTSYLKELLSSWTNIKTAFSIAYRTKPMGMDNMLDYLKLSLDGHHHSGIDDCRNIAKICRVLMENKHNITVPTTRWMPNQLWYVISPYVLILQTITLSRYDLTRYSSGSSDDITRVVSNKK